jgi:broad specificity phosphatase PhoE
MTSIIIVRHGQTEWNMLGKWQGSADIPLNSRGLEQAAALANRLADWQIDAIYSSDLQRAAQTAAAIAKHHDLAVIIDPAWRERDAGECEGMTREEIYAKFHKMFEMGVFQAPNGETPDQLYARVIPAFEQLEANHVDQTVLIVSHGGTIAALIAHVLNLPHQESWRFTAGYNTGLSRIEKTDRGWRLTRLNDTSHLE